ncbi:hypothetical protein A4G29_19820 [Mycobacterium kansasii]|nr:hypothetical protein A4G29_19820 [Mycobacterium kansasii]
MAGRGGRSDGVAAATDVTLVIGGSGYPLPSQSYVNTVVADYVTPTFPGFTTANAQSLYTPAQSYIGSPASRR